MGKIRNKDLERGKRVKRHFKSRGMVYVSEGEERDALFPAPGSVLEDSLVCMFQGFASEINSYCFYYTDLRC